ncbi:MAG: hypothetical protein FWC43_00685 [Planctomycetaceae bacterium]|nr:hypothetical protein [Planctomycetaceae bacterium]
MTKREIVWPEPIPGFDPVKWKRQVHAEIERETEGMTKEEVREYFRQASERGKQRRAELANRQNEKVGIGNS